MFFSNYKSGDYGQLHQNKEEKNQLKRMWWWLFHGVYFVISLGIVIFFIFGHDLGEKGYYLTDYLFTTSSSQKYLDFTTYYVIGAVILFMVFGLFSARSKSEIINNIQGRDFEGKNPSLFQKIHLRILTPLDWLFYYFFYPVSFLFLAVDKHSPLDRQRFYIRYGWLSHLRFNYFKRTVDVVDGYERSSELSIFKDYVSMLAGTKTNEEGEMDSSFRSILMMFKSKEHLTDTFHIAEGYILNDSAKVDKILTKKEYKDRLENLYGGDIRKFKLYDGKETVLFSADLIKDLLVQESNRFEKYLKKYALTPSGTSFTRSFRKEFTLIRKDKKVVEMVSWLKLPNALSPDEKMTESIFVERVNFLLLCYFKYISLFFIINQYINLPAGTVVSRMKDYTLRRISEDYTTGKIISIQIDKNDGSSEKLWGDSLANLFLLAWNYYNHAIDNSFKDIVYDVFNFRDERLERVLTGEEDSLLIADEASKTFAYLDTHEAPELTEEQIEIGRNFTNGIYEEFEI